MDGRRRIEWVVERCRLLRVIGDLIDNLNGVLKTQQKKDS